MCLLCNNENTYRAYMDYLEARLRKGQNLDAAGTAQAERDEIEAAARLADAQAQVRAQARAHADDPANDKTLSPFFCSPINR